MAYDEALAERLRKAFDDRESGKDGAGGASLISEKKMFGGLAIMADGRMTCGVNQDLLMVRVGPAQYEKALRLAHVRPMDFTGRPMKGFVYVDPAGTRTVAALRKWVRMSIQGPEDRAGKKASGKKKPVAGSGRKSKP